MAKKKGPAPTVDIIIEYQDGIVLIERKNIPFGWAIPGGFVDYNETLEEAALREAKEETGLELNGLRQFHAYSAPERDPRGHTISMVFIAQGSGMLRAATDARSAAVFRPRELPAEIAFDHRAIIGDYFSWKAGKECSW